MRGYHFISPIIFLIMTSQGQALAASWEYKINHQSGKEPQIRSKRSYIKVISDRSQVFRQIDIESDCVKIHGEQRYGKCVHEITEKNGTKIKIDSGEEVGLVGIGKGFAALATMEYGCCGAPNIVRLYSSKGIYLGYYETFDNLRMEIDSEWSAGSLSTKTATMIRSGKNPGYNREKDDLELKLIIGSDESSYRMEGMTLASSPPWECVWILENLTISDALDSVGFSINLFQCEEHGKSVNIQCARKNPSWICNISKSLPGMVAPFGAYK